MIHVCDQVSIHTRQSRCRLTSSRSFRVRIRGLALPDFEFPPKADELLAAYLARTDDTLLDLLHSGARWPDELGADPCAMEIFAGCRALQDESTSPSVHLAGLSFAHLLYHWRLTREAFATLQAIDELLAGEGSGTTDDPIMAHEDPRYVAGLLCAFGRWHGDDHLTDAITWFDRSLERAAGLEYHGPVLVAVGLCFHRLGRSVAAEERHVVALDRLRVELVREIDDRRLIFHEELEAQIEIVRCLVQRLSAGEAPHVEMTRYGWAMDPERHRHP